ncbi:hypothetical protein CSKR_112877, partial [Clonorchis sinensis]
GCSVNVSSRLHPTFIIVVIDSMTSVFNNDASLPNNHDLFESLIRCLHLQTLIQAIWIETDNKIATDIGWQPYLAAPPTRRSEDHAVKGWPPLRLRHSELGTENSILFGKRWLGIRNTCPNRLFYPKDGSTTKPIADCTCEEQSYSLLISDLSIPIGCQSATCMLRFPVIPHLLELLKSMTILHTKMFLCG